MCRNSCRIMSSSVEDVKSPLFWRAAVGEFIGTLVLVVIGCGTCVGGEGDWEKNLPTTVQISLAFGLAVATVVWGLAHVSGGHVNPAVTVAFLVTRQISIVRGLLYIVAQCAGALSGAGILYLLTPETARGRVGLTTINEALRVEQAFGVEMLITFVLVFTVFASVDSRRTDLNGSSPLTIGFSVTLCHLFAIKYTGSSMNPARTFGPTVISGLWDNHWVYWCGPLLGGIIAGFLYELVFAANASCVKARDFLLSSNYKPAEYVSASSSAAPENAGQGPTNGGRVVAASETMETMHLEHKESLLKLDELSADQQV